MECGTVQTGSSFGNDVRGGEAPKLTLYDPARSFQVDFDGRKKTCIHGMVTWSGCARRTPTVRMFWQTPECAKESSSTVSTYCRRDDGESRGQKFI